eukprot:scaffold137432_cov60-Phaeocystis_antarctica.AAC.1
MLTHAAQPLALPGSQFFNGHPGISVVEVKPLPSGLKALFEGCIVADIPDSGIQPPSLPPNGSTAPGQL